MENISKAIIEVMKAVNNIWKNTTVWTWNNAYKAVSDKDVKETIRTSMIENQLVIMQTWIIPTIKLDRWEEEVTWNKQTSMKTKQSVFTEVITSYKLIHSSWESIDLAWYGQWVDSQDKGAWKATTYALKNTLLNIFLVPTGEDTDATHSESIATPQKEKKWYNSFEKQKADMIKKIESWESTPESIIKAIEKAGFTINNKVKGEINNLTNK